MEFLSHLGTDLIANIMIYAINFQKGFSLFFTLNNMLAIFGGVTIGCLFGALPGFGIALSVALVMPFTFSLEPLTALSVLAAVYVGAIYGGSISAILLNTPGTPASACTCIDGYALARQGKAGKALHMANWASCVGDVVSTVIVILLIFPLSKLALYFKSPEYFALILFSVTIIGGLCGNKSILKGLLSGALGFLVASIGMDPVSSFPRFTFGSMDLTNGIAFVPLLIGIFAIPEILRQLNRVRSASETRANLSIAETVSLNPDDGRLTFAEFKASFKHMLRGGIVGLIVGLIPGMGAMPAAFVSYERARSNANNPELFGKGSLEGIAAAEAGNNAVNGATLVPLLTLGVPGDIITAIMLGAFMIFDLQPGPMLFIQHADLIFGLFCALLMCDVSLRIVSVVFIRYAQYVTRIPVSYVFPVVAIFCIYGSYIANNSVFDILIAFAFGIVGFIMLSVGLPTTPFLIAFILAPLLEKSLRRSLIISDGNPMIFFQSPIAILFFVLTALSVWSMTKGRLKKLAPKEN